MYIDLRRTRGVATARARGPPPNGIAPPPFKREGRERHKGEVGRRWKKDNTIESPNKCSPYQGNGIVYVPSYNWARSVPQCSPPPPVVQKNLTKPLHMQGVGVSGQWALMMNDKWSHETLCQSYELQRRKWSLCHVYTWHYSCLLCSYKILV